MSARVDDCCGDPSNCVRVCGIFGLRAAKRAPARFYGCTPLRPDELRLPEIPQPYCKGCDCAPGPTCFDKPRKIGLFERLIAGPQGDVTLKDDFLSFLGCLACGTGLAFLLVGIVMFFRTVAP